MKPARETTEIHCTVFDTDEGTNRRVALDTLTDELAHPERFAWIAIHGPDIGLVDSLAAEQGLSVHVQDHFSAPEILPRIQDAPDHLAFYLYEVVDPERHLDTTQELQPIEIVRLLVVLGKDLVITYHQRDVAAVSDTLRICSPGLELPGRSPAFVVFLLLRASLHDTAHLNLANDNYLDGLVERVHQLGATHLPADVGIAGRNVLLLKRAASSLYILLMRLGTQRSPFIGQPAREAFLQIMGNADAVRSAIDSSRNQLDGVLAALQIEAANRTGDIARVLTIISGVLMPISVVAGIYGMNFEGMPELKAAYGYPAALTFMALIGIGQLLLFRRLGWFRGGPDTRPSE